MSIEYENKQKVHSEIFWSQVGKAWPETTVANKKEMSWGEKTEVCIVLCPLYSPGVLGESTLMQPPANIEGSRVANKVNAYTTMIHAINGYISAFGGEMHLNVIFANKGVLFSGEPSSEQNDTLVNHKQVYLDFFYNFCRDNHISMEFSDYNDWKVNFPTFVDPNTSIPQELISLRGVKDLPESKMLAQLNQYFGFQAEDSKKNRHAIERILNMEGLGYNAAFWLIAGYLAFDNKISDIIGPNGIYIAAERFEPLFGIARLTKSLKELIRIQLKA